METDRRAILHLVALGRISSAEAERLLIAWNEGRDTGWILAGCFAMAILTQLRLNTLLPGSALSLWHGLKLVAHLLGGIL